MKHALSLTLRGLTYELRAYNPISPPEKGNVNSRFFFHFHFRFALAKSFPRWFWLTALSSIPDGFHIWAMAEALRQAKMTETDRRQQRRGLGAAQKFANSFHIFPAVETLFSRAHLCMKYMKTYCVYSIYSIYIYLSRSYVPNAIHSCDGHVESFSIWAALKYSTGFNDNLPRVFSSACVCVCVSPKKTISQRVG